MSAIQVRGHFIPFVILVLCVEMETIAFAMEEDQEQMVRAELPFRKAFPCLANFVPAVAYRFCRFHMVMMRDSCNLLMVYHFRIVSNFACVIFGGHLPG